MILSPGTSTVMVPPGTTVDPGLLEPVAGNLLENAVRQDHGPHRVCPGLSVLHVRSSADDLDPIGDGRGDVGVV